MGVPFSAMVRRSFRMGLRLGLLFGVGFAMFKTLQSRRAGEVGAAGPAAEPGAWEPLRPDAAEQPRPFSPAAGDAPRTGAGSSPANVRPSEPRRPAPAAPPPRPASPTSPSPSASASASAPPARPAAPTTPPPSLRMPDVPATPPSAASEGRAATSTPATPPPPVVDEVGEPILEPAPPIESTPRRSRTRATPPPPVVDEVGEPILEPAPPIEATPRRSRPRATPAAKGSPSTGAAEGTPPEKQLLHADVTPSPDPVLDVIPSDDIVPATRPVRKAAAKKQAAAPTPTPAPAPAKKAAKKATKAAKKAALPGWVEALDGTCPPTHPVKAKLASRLFHLPGMFAYVRTRPDRCYLDADTAVADGFNAAKR